ncbi:hypothetical protein [Paraliomyxa miuraensis]|uniref:hypothetical protein n=1 Tax=Paraliomyxa miuraensis TaxID=376150 RepID=UPI002254FDA3|nr:hypothetical protein [Paraliomyxa miuraensis]MCX4243921.1 hypothetical protein [Paraliomyxa miuraensis]
MVLPAIAFTVVVVAGLSVATMLPHTARAHGGCSECTHAITHWTCGPTNKDNRRCHKTSAALCMNLATECVGSTTAISGGGLGDGGNDEYSISTTTY